MDKPEKVGGNVMRCVFDPGGAFSYGRPAWEEVEGGKFDATKFTSGANSYWRRFDKFLYEAKKRDFSAQPEVWGRFDWQRTDRWGVSAFNPTKNTNYTESESGLSGHYSSLEDNPFTHGSFSHRRVVSAFLTIPPSTHIWVSLIGRDLKRQVDPRLVGPIYFAQEKKYPHALDRSTRPKSTGRYRKTF
jgi:hypothetical protein